MNCRESRTLPGLHLERSCEMNAPPLVVPANAWRTPGPIRRGGCFERRCPTAFAQQPKPVVMGVRRDDGGVCREKIRSAAKLCLHRAPYLDRFVIGIDLDIVPAHYRSVGDVVFQFHPMRQPDRYSAGS